MYLEGSDISGRVGWEYGAFIFCRYVYFFCCGIRRGFLNLAGRFFGGDNILVTSGGLGIFAVWVVELFILSFMVFERIWFLLGWGDGCLEGLEVVFGVVSGV